MKTKKALNEVVEYAKQFEGVPYIWAGNSFLKGLDCSGFAQHILLYMGLYDFQDRTCRGIVRFLVSKGARIEDFKTAGSLLFYGPKIGEEEHVAFAISDSELIEAGGAGSNCKDRKTARILDANVRTRLINHRKDFLYSIPIQYKEI